jgi:hypothetical protein
VDPAGTALIVRADPEKVKKVDHVAPPFVERRRLVVLSVARTVVAEIGAKL